VSRAPTVRRDTSSTLEVCLEKYLRSVGLLSVWHLAKIHKYWLFILDGPTAQKVRPYKLHRNVLTLRVVDAAYGAVFRYKKRSVIEKINQLDDEIHVIDIKFQVGPMGHALWEGGSPEKVYYSHLKELDLERQKSLYHGQPMNEDTANQVSSSFFATKHDYVDLVLPDGTDVRRHKADIEQHRRSTKVKVSDDSRQEADDRAKVIQNPAVKKAFSKALAARLDQKKRP